VNLPNALTLSRIILAGVLVFLLEQRTTTCNILAIVVFTIASLTDFYDGHLAKTRGLVSNFGKIMDPVSDKILLLSVFGVLAHLGFIAWWMFIVIAVREVLVTIWRLWAMGQGRILAAERVGKIKTVVQIVAVSVLLLYCLANGAAQGSSWFMSCQGLWVKFNTLLMVAAVILTVYSGMDYLRKDVK